MPLPTAREGALDSYNSAPSSSCHVELLSDCAKSLASSDLVYVRIRATRSSAARARQSSLVVYYSSCGASCVIEIAHVQTVE